MLCRAEPWDVESTSLGLVAITGHLHRKTSLSQRRFEGILAQGERKGLPGRGSHLQTYRLVQRVGRNVIYEKMRTS